MPSPEELARQKIDKTRHKGWGAHVPRVSRSAPRRMHAVTPDDGRKFTELYNVQHLQSAQLDRVSRVSISSIQRLYSILRQFFFWIETLTPQGQFTQGDRQRLVRVQRRVWAAPASLIAG